MIVKKTYKFKLKLTKTQDLAFRQWLGTCRFLYNLCLEYKIYLWQTAKISISKFNLIKELPSLKDIDWIKCVPSQTLQAVVERLDRTYQNFFKLGFGFPKFAKKHRYNSFLLKQGVKLHQNTCRITLPKIGKIKYFKSQEVEGEIKQTTITKEPDGWYICFACEVEQIPKPLTTNRKIGLDLGIKHFAVTSDGKYFDNPKVLEQYQRELRVLQRCVSRKKKRSNNWYKAVRKVSRLHQKIRRIRQDFHHKISTQLISESQAVVVEDLKVSNMVKNKKLAKAISDCGWNSFVTMLAYKATWNERQFVKIAPNYTSKDCSICGYRMEDMPLSVREWECPACNTFHNRDENAALNILNKARAGQALCAVT